MTSPLSPGQRALWFLHRAAPESAAYTIAGAGRIAGSVDIRRLRRAFEAVMDRHASLRTTFPVEDGAPVQRVGPVSPGLFEEVDGAGWGPHEVPERVADLAFRPFDLERGPAFRVLCVGDAPGGTILAVSLHHVVGDLWSLALLLREAGEAYDDLTAGREPLAGQPPLPFSYTELVARQAEALAGEEGERLRSFWADRLAGGVPALDLPTDHPRPPVQSFEGAVVSRRLGGPTTESARGRKKALGALARSRKTNLFSVLMAGFQAVLGRYAGQDLFTVGTPTSGRVKALGGSGAELAGLVGYLVNPVPLFADLGGDPTFGEVVERVRDESASALEHQGYPLPLLAEILDPGGGRGRAALFSTLLVLQKSPIPGMRELPAFALGRAGTPLRLGSLELESIGLPQRGSQFDLSLFVTEEDGALVASLEYDSALFEAATAERILGHLDTFLGAAAEEPDRRLADLPILTAEERRRLLGDRASGGASAADLARVDPPGGGLLHELVAAQAERTPAADALVVGKSRVSYRELTDRAGRVARRLETRLRERGVGPEAPVGVFLRRGSDLVPALLGVLEAGAAYVPMDPGYPAERIAVIAADSSMPLVLTEASLVDRLATVPLGGAAVVTVEEALGEDGGRQPEERRPPPDADGLAYVIYTSGSTGRPKGVAISHRSASAMVRWAGGAYSAEELAGTLFSTSVCFDLSVFEMFVPLAHGGTVVVADDALALPALAAGGEVTLVNTVPSAMTRLVEAGALPPSVTTVNLAGEPLRGSLVEALHQVEGVRRVVNLYGPSEDTTYSTIAECPASEDREPTIGRVVTGGRAYVVDRSLRLRPEGVPGELLLGGAGLARGYLGRPALTAERFVPDPFAGGEGGGPAGGRLYRTGDRARFLADGRLEFQGRFDHQVKVRGFRIELGEVELALRAHPAVAEAVVVARGEGVDRSLVAYLVAAPEGEAALPAAGELRTFVGARLPDYMVPSAFVALDAMPLTPNGKVDRRALPEPGAGRPELSDEYVAPETEVELILADLWSRVLGVETIGIHDSFFELGGHSLKATEVLLSVRELFGVDVPVHSLFERPTIAGLSVAIAEQLLAGAEDEEVADLLAGHETGT